MNKRQAKKLAQAKLQPSMSQEDMMEIINKLAKQIELLNGTVVKLTDELSNTKVAEPQVNKMNLFMTVAKVKVQDTVKLLENSDKFTPEKMVSKFKQNINVIKNALTEVKDAILEIPQNISEKVNDLKNQAIQKVDNVLTYAKEVIEIQLATPKAIINEIGNAIESVKVERKEAMEDAKEKYQNRSKDVLLKDGGGVMVHTKPKTVSERMTDILEKNPSILENKEMMEEIKRMVSPSMLENIKSKGTYTEKTVDEPKKNKQIEK